MATTHKRVLSTLGRNGPTRRNLFGPVDREQLQVEYRAALSQDLEEATKRWGFDFVSGKPLESGDFQWEGVSDTRVPLLYRSCRPRAVQARGQRAASSVGSTKRGRVVPPESEKENIPHTPEKRTLDLEDVEKTPRKEGARTGLKRKQTNITGARLSTPVGRLSLAVSCHWVNHCSLSQQISIRLKGEWFGCHGNPESEIYHDGAKAPRGPHQQTVPPSGVTYPTPSMRNKTVYR